MVTSKQILSTVLGITLLLSSGYLIFQEEPEPPGGQSFQKEWDDTNKTLAVKSLSGATYLTIQQISHSPDLCTCEEVFNITSYVNYEIDIQKDFKVVWQKHKGKHNIASIDWYIQKKQAYNISMPDYGDVQKSKVIPDIITYDNITDTWMDGLPALYKGPAEQGICGGLGCKLGDCRSLQKWNITRETTNGTEVGIVCFDTYEVLQASPLKVRVHWHEAEIIGEHNVTRHRLAWNKFSPIGKTLQKNKSYVVKLVLHKKPELGSVSIKTVPIFAGIEEVNLTWWNASWSKKREIKINNTGGSALTYYQVFVNLTDTPINETSLRVVNETSDATVPHWCENITDENCTKLWFNNTGIPASAWQNDTYYVYYDEPSASSTSNGDNTFVFFDDFEREYIGGNITNPWTRYASNPIFAKNATSSWDSHFVNAPTICTHLNGTAYQDVSNNYFMYYCGSGHNDGLNNDQTGLALSTDLYNWTRLDNGDGGRVLKFGNGVFQDGQWDDADVQLGTVLYDNGTFHVWYNGNNNPSSDYCRLGYANSTDGKNWTKYTGNPILSQGPDGDADDLYVPVVIKDGSTWKMWYAGQKTGGGRIALMYATASNPEGPWTKHSNAHIYDPGYNFFPTEIWNESGTFHLIFYNIDAQPYKFRHATSSDGITWTYDGIIFEEGASGQWDDLAIQEISQVNISGTWYNYYCGYDAGGEPMIGAATGTVRVPTPAVSKWTIGGTEGTDLRLNNGKLEVGMIAAGSALTSATVPAPFVINSYIDYAMSGANTAYSYIGPSNPNLQSHFGYNSYHYTTQWTMYKYPANTGTPFGTAASIYKDVEIKVQAASQECWIGTDNIISDTNFGATDPYIWIYGNNGVTYVEFVFVRKYTASEPASELGSEEDVPTNPITITSGNRTLFCNWTSNTTFANIEANLTNCTDFFCYNSTSQRWTFYNINRTVNVNTFIHKHAAIFVHFNATTTVECNILTAETITIPSNAWYYTALRESTAKTLTEINTSITSDSCVVSDLYGWNSTAGAYTNTCSYSVLPNEGFAIYCSTGCNWDGGV